jgi:hypothetical protein
MNNGPDEDEVMRRMHVEAYHEEVAALRKDAERMGCRNRRSHGQEMNKLLQRQRVVEYIRARGRATNMELVMALAVANPWKRLREEQEHFYTSTPSDKLHRLRGNRADYISLTERIVRRKIKTKGGANVVEYVYQRVA